jgi:hypothetical protein
MPHKGSQQRKLNQPLQGPTQKVAGTISAEAARRIAGREEILRRICELARSEAVQRGVQVNQVNIHPAWSHEYKEQAGVVVDVDVTASNDDRFSYWDALREGVDELAASLPPADRSWLESELSLAIIRA